jgi:predicted negative regulator of RcsB-dependent stress response
MAYDLEEQEQLDAMKAWWRANGNKVLTVVAAAAIAYAGFQGWKIYQHKQSAAASAQYQVLMKPETKDTKTIKSIAGDLMDNYGSTPYAGRAALLAAKANYQDSDTTTAIAQLEWAIKHAKEDAVKALAVLQLASIQFETQAYDAALKTLAEKHDPAFDGLFADLKGDILVAQGKKAEAKTAYTEALAKLDPQGRYHLYTQHKLEALGS